MSTQETQKILVVEDEPGISSFVAKGLQGAGYEAKVVDTGKAAVDEAISTKYDLIILDIGLPDIDGFEVLEQLHGQGVPSPIIMLTARSSVEDTVTGLESGADDYMTKPFRFEELLARVKLRLRTATPPDTGASATILTAGDIKMDLRTRTTTVKGRQVDLSAREFSMLQAFLEHPDQVLSRQRILDTVWGYDFDPGSNVVDVYIRYLRRKIGNKYIVTVRGLGYRLVAE
ncbi:MAG: response regulator transcription factor [Varibaculum sp.]|nr:response regulator transcription factor [Varibaculum sp.]